MKNISVVCSALSVLLVVLTALQTPVIKFPTPFALSKFEAGFVEKELPEREQKTRDFFKDQILGNQKQTTQSLERTQLFAAALFVLMLVQNIILLCRLKLTEKSVSETEN